MAVPSSTTLRMSEVVRKATAGDSAGSGAAWCSSSTVPLASATFTSITGSAYCPLRLQRGVGVGDLQHRHLAGAQRQRQVLGQRALDAGLRREVDDRVGADAPR